MPAEKFPIRDYAFASISASIIGFLGWQLWVDGQSISKLQVEIENHDKGDVTRDATTREIKETQIKVLAVQAKHEGDINTANAQISDFNTLYAARHRDLQDEFRALSDRVEQGLRDCLVSRSGIK